MIDDDRRRQRSLARRGDDRREARCSRRIRRRAGIRVELGGQYASQQEAFRALLLVLGARGGERDRA